MASVEGRLYPCGEERIALMQRVFKTTSRMRYRDHERQPSVRQHLIRSARYPLQALCAAFRSSTQVEFIETLIAAITAGQPLTFAAIRSLAQERWLAGFSLLGLYLLLCLHEHAPWLFWTMVLFLFLPISLMLF
jgi:hypothetical protein